MRRRYHRKNPDVPLSEGQFMTAMAASLALAGIGAYLVLTNSQGGVVGALGNVGTSASLATFA
jgi:hypothetical protein